MARARRWGRAAVVAVGLPAAFAAAAWLAFGPSETSAIRNWATMGAIVGILAALVVLGRWRFVAWTVGGLGVAALASLVLANTIMPVRDPTDILPVLLLMALLFIGTVIGIVLGLVAEYVRHRRLRAEARARTADHPSHGGPGPSTPQPAHHASEPPRPKPDSPT